jgi:hypothetical protein
MGFGSSEVDLAGKIALPGLLRCEKPLQRLKFSGFDVVENRK